VVLGDLSSAEADLAALRGGARGAVRVAAFPSAARVLLPRLWTKVGDLGAGAPELRFVEGEPEVAIGALVRREVDVAVVHSYSLLPRELTAGVDQHPLLAEPVLLALPAERAQAHRLAPGATADLARFATEPWLLPGPETSSCYEMTRRACGAAGFIPSATGQSGDFAVLMAMVAVGAGVTLVPRMALPAGFDSGPATASAGVSLHPLKRPVARHVLAITRAGTAQRPDVRAVLDALVDVAAERAAD
jgi:DNA-binding transcriptional LysR family regulator